MTLIFKSILVATDFTEPANVVVAYGRALAEAFHASLHVLHVLDAAALGGDEGCIGPAPNIPRRAQAIERDAHDDLNHLFSESEGDNLRAHLAATTGDAVDGILRDAQEHDIDLIVMGTRGRDGILGSAAEEVVRKSPCPVLVVHHPQHDLINLGVEAVSSVIA
jgi:nucleotide-binding universal stress UspA family protein